MKKIAFPMILLILVLSLVLAGCTRSATKGVELPVDTPDIPFPVGPENNPNRITEIVAASQTAESQMGNEVEPVEQDVATATPAEEVEETTEPAPTNQPIVVPTATPGLPTTYTLQEGEFPYCIARRFNINPNDLLSVNNISGVVSPGTTLTIPTNSTWPTEFARSLITHPTTYNVLAGDTIYKIACNFGDVDPNDIIAANNLEAPYTITAGQVLNIP